MTDHSNWRARSLPSIWLRHPNVSPPSHRPDAFGAPVHGEHGRIEAALHEVEFHICVTGAVPEIVKLPWVCLEVVEFTQAVPVVDDELVPAVAVHRGERPVGLVQRIVELAAYEFAMFVGRFLAADHRRQ